MDDDVSAALESINSKLDDMASHMAELESAFEKLKDELPATITETLKTAGEDDRTKLEAALEQVKTNSDSIKDLTSHVGTIERWLIAQPWPALIAVNVGIAPFSQAPIS